MAQLMNTINGTYNRCQLENIGISKNLLRSMVKDGIIACVHVGKNQVLINYDVLMSYLNTGGVQTSTPEVSGDIRPVLENVRR